MANKSRPKQVTFRVSDEEYAQIQQKIAESGKNQQEYLLACAMEKDIYNLDGLKDLMTELKRQGINLNQLTKQLNEKGYIDYKDQLPAMEKELIDIWQLLRQFLAKLV